jgi:hypothetical protein
MTWGEGVIIVLLMLLLNYVYRIGRQLEAIHNTMLKRWEM